MATMNLSDTLSQYVVNFVYGEGIPISFPICDNGLAIIASHRLNLWFKLSEKSIHFDEEVFDAILGILIHIVGQSPVYNKESKY